MGSLREAEGLRLKAGACHAGSWSGSPVRCRCAGRSTWLSPACERLDDDHASTAARALWAEFNRLIRGAGLGRGGDVQQFAGEREAGLAGGAGEQAVVADAMEATRQDMEQEAADELVGGEGHDLLPIGAVATVILVAEGYPAPVEGDQPAVRYRDPVRVARQVGEHCLRSSERRLGVDYPALLPDGSKVAQKGLPIGQVRHGSEEGEPPTVMQREQPGEEQPAEQLAEHAHRKQEGRTRRDPVFPVRRDAAARHDHVHMRMMRHRRSPGVKHGRDADPGSEVLRIGGDGQHRLCLAEVADIAFHSKAAVYDLLFKVASSQEYYDSMERLVNTGTLDFVQIAYTILPRAAEQRLLDTYTANGIAVQVNIPLKRRGSLRPCASHQLGHVPICHCDDLAITSISFQVIGAAGCSGRARTP